MELSQHTTPVTRPVEFSGKIGEYFGIWIVNLLLSIVTLGIYSAWAKVRTNQYFYGHTKIDGHSFRYLATPLQILKGRIIAFLVFVLFSILSTTTPLAGIAFAILFVFMAPWLIIQNLRFTMRMTSYRNVRFSFNGRYGNAFLNFILLPILSIFTLYLALPWVLRRIDTYLFNNVAYGGRPLQVKNRNSQYYLASLAALGTGVVFIIGLVAILGVFGIALSGLIHPENQGVTTATMIAGFALLMLLYWMGLSLVVAVYKSIIRNHLFSVAEINEVATFKSTMHPLSYMWLTLSNTLILLGTLGFGFPITKVRHTAYLARITSVNIHPKAASIIDSAGQDTSAFGEEAANFFDVDLSLT